MGYEIIYGKQFIKLSNDNFIPMINAGSSNCYEVSHGGRERRERSWFNYRINSGISATANDLLAFPIDLRKKLIAENEQHKIEYENWDDYDDKSFGYFSAIAVGSASTHKTSFGQFENIFKLGIKQALTIEELRKGGITINVRTSQFDEKKLIELGLPKINEYPHTTAEIEELIENTKDNYKGFIYVTLHGHEDSFKEIKKQHFPTVKKEKPLTEVTEAYAIRLKNFGYFQKRTKNAFMYSSTPKLWYSAKQVNTVMKRLAKHSFIMKHEPAIETVKLSQPRKVRV